LPSSNCSALAQANKLSTTPNVLNHWAVVVVFETKNQKPTTKNQQPKTNNQKLPTKNQNLPQPYPWACLAKYYTGLQQTSTFYLVMSYELLVFYDLFTHN
jgi:hypothetical protein